MNNKDRYNIGIDIGGTNTDGVLVDSHLKIIASAKFPTTEHVHHGFKAVLENLLESSGVTPDKIAGVSLGTTHATNAILQREALYRVGVIRLAGHHPASMPSCFSWPTDLQKAVHINTYSVDGGYECHGDPITPFDPDQFKKVVERLVKEGAESLAIIGVFSPLKDFQELEAERIVKGILGPDFPISLSHKIGGIGFIERENSTILNAALKKVMKNGFCQLKTSQELAGLDCPLWITQNNGSRMSLERAAEYPVLTISAGPTNSFIGGAKLAGTQDAIIVDIGGTSTDVGIVRKGFPRRRLNKSHIGGIPLNFSMPDVLSIALGGGSHIAWGEKIEIGPLSCGRETFSRGISFGGGQLTLTDIALSLEYVCIPGADPARLNVSREICRSITDKARGEIQKLVYSVGPDEQHLPVVMIGGGAGLFPQTLWEERFCFPSHANVANAYGAALAEYSATIDRVVSTLDRQKVVEELEENVMKLAVQEGADPKHVRIVDKQIIPYHYAPEPMARMIITAAG